MNAFLRQVQARFDSLRQSSTPVLVPVPVPMPAPPPPSSTVTVSSAGVPPAETATGALVPSVVAPGVPGETAPAKGGNELTAAGVDAGSIASGGAVALLGGLLVLMLLGSRPGRR